MIPSSVLESYYKLKPVSRYLYLKQGVRYYPQLHPAFSLFKRCTLEGYSLDASGTTGVLALQQTPQKAVVLETSFAALTCAKKNTEKAPNLSVSAAALWQLEKNIFDTIIAAPASDKGSARVLAELKGVHNCLKPNGTAYIVMHKDQGAKRYEKHLTKLFGKTTIVAKEAGWRLMKVSAKKALTTSYEAPSFNVLDISVKAELGVYAAGKLDPGTAFLLDHYSLDNSSGKSTLDLGCGYGILSLKASLAGARVTALDDDLLAVQSTHNNAQTYGLDLRCLHSDISSELKDDERFDVIITNPPFHLGKLVKLELPHAFIAAAHKHLNPKGELILVANKALAYEKQLEWFSDWQQIAANDKFKVLRAIK